MGEPVAWFEMFSAEPAALHGFYSEVFGWKVEPMGDPEYATVDTQSGSGIGGAIVQGESAAQTIVSIEVEDLNSFLEKIAQAGGRTVTPITETPGVVAYAQFADPAGNVVGIFKWLT